MPEATELDVLKKDFRANGVIIETIDNQLFQLSFYQIFNLVICI